MEIKNYNIIVSKYTPKEDKLKNCILAFVCGGLIGLIGQGLIDIYQILFSITFKEASSLMLVSIIFVACLFTSLGFFDKWVSFFKCGLIIPITGFAHSLMSCGLEYKKEGPIFGLGSNVFKLAGSVIFYGVVSAWFFGIIRYFIGG